MQILRVVIFIVISIILGSVAFENHGTLYAQQVDNQEENNVNFQWAFIAIKRVTEGLRPEAITRDTTLKSGDQIKFYVKLKNRCYVYLIYHSSQGELNVLFPYRFKQLNKEYYAVGSYYVPKGDQWFELDEHVGLETFYLLASAKRLYELEELVNDYESADKAKKLEFKGRILTEIRKLRKQNFKFKTSAERPAAIIGNLRGTEEVKVAVTRELADSAIEISADTFYSRTFTIDHK